MHCTFQARKLSSLYSSEKIFCTIGSALCIKSLYDGMIKIIALNVCNMTFFKFRFKESIFIKCWLLKLEVNLYCWLCRTCTTAKIFQQNTSWMNRFVRTEKNKESCRANPLVISNGSCTQITKVLLIDWEFAAHNLLNNIIELVDALLRENRSSSFIHDLTFMRAHPQSYWSSTTACVSVESWWNDRLWPYKQFPSMSDAILTLWKSARELATSECAPIEVKFSF